MDRGETYVLVGSRLVFRRLAWLVVNAFRESTLWGIGSLVISPVALVFGLINFGENKVPLLLSVAGLAMYFMGAGAAAEQAMSMQQ